MRQFSSTFQQCILDLEERIDPQIESHLKQEWVDFSYGRFHGEVFKPKRRTVSPPRVEWPQVVVNDALENYELMALQQFHSCSEALAKGTGDLLNVRCNYGTGILPSLFGLELFIMDKELQTLPTIRPLGTRERVERLLDGKPPEINDGYGRRVLEMGEIFNEILEDYPKIAQTVQVYHPDLQGPLDACELIFGSGLFLELYDRPDLVHHLLELVCVTYFRFMQAWATIHPLRKDGNTHWGMFHRGNLMLRDDSAMNLSPEMVREFVLPYDQRLLNLFGGGAVHFCGKGDHYLADLCQLQNLYAINLTQPELNNMEYVFTHTVDRGLKLLGLAENAVATASAHGRPLHGCVHSR
jgi:hypothetical protein